MKPSYKITSQGKLLILGLVMCSIGTLCGFSYRIYTENDKWDSLIYPGINIGNMNLEGLTKTEALHKLNTTYINSSNSTNINIKFKDKIFTIESYKLIKDTLLSSTIDQVLAYEDNLTPLEKHRLISKQDTHEIQIPVTINEDMLVNFINGIESHIDTSPQNAKIKPVVESKLQIENEVLGYTLNKEELKKAITESLSYLPTEDVTISAPVKLTKPNISSENLSAINAPISSFSTDYSTSSFERASNIELAAKLINGRILLPNDIFSFNEIVGNRTSDRGFMDAPIIVGNKVESGLGGGICQVTSTLYNAILNCGITPIERQNHNLPVSYVALGTDATVVWNSIDFKFKNTLEYPLLIEAKTTNRSLYINIYSNSSLLNKRYVIKNDVYERIPSTIEPVKDPSLQTGKQYTINQGSDGYRVRVFRYTYENGSLINTETLSNDYYAPTQTKVRVGIK
ncbi:VanW family protein [Clostridium sp. 'White wine YQ']|uniref:VanW family protein n=1 Tax=Clostridium sp. 'White wine YQ' TaxID=3027474 RepID=UPI002365C50A|nr:VanW family protein [Clostridium sp. 'White wine YQ']MDD7796420.1 VanW family protein [Clostridium sp. 'White wine YQ']